MSNAKPPLPDLPLVPMRLYVGWGLMVLYAFWHFEMISSPVRALRQSAIDKKYLYVLFFSIPFAALIPLISLTVFANCNNKKTRIWSLLLLVSFLFVSYYGLTGWDVDYSEFPFKPLKR